MGKITNAFERYQKDKAVKTEDLPLGRSEDLAPDESVSPLVRETFLHRGFDPKLVVLSAPESTEAENFRILRSQILYPKQGEVPKTIMVTSAFPGEGKTFVTANLAVSIGQGIDETVLLVDCDLRRPTLHRLLGYTNDQGLHEYLVGTKKIPDLLVRTKYKQLSLLTAGSSVHNPAELLASARMKQFVEEAKNRYENRFVILDAPPSQITAETGVLANYVDKIIFVVMAQKTPRETIQRSIDNLGKHKILGVVFNGYRGNFGSYPKYHKKYYK
jgi:protein-tyrosine kinase